MLYQHLSILITVFTVPNTYGGSLATHKHTEEMFFVAATDVCSCVGVLLLLLHYTLMLQLYVGDKAIVSICILKGM